MGEIKTPEPVKLICGLLTGDPEMLIRAKGTLTRGFGSIDGESDIIPFDFTAYYQKELGLMDWDLTVRHKDIDAFADCFDDARAVAVQDRARR